MSHITTPSGLKVKIYENEPVMDAMELYMAFDDTDLLFCEPTSQRGKLKILAGFHKLEGWNNARYIQEILLEKPEWSSRSLVVESKRTMMQRERKRRMYERYMNGTDPVDYKPASRREEIAEWLDRTKFIDFLTYMTDHVMGQDQVKIITANVYNYLYCVANGKKHNNNFILAAPSGCGKTETFRTIKAYFEEEIPSLPIVQVDLTSITEEGFKGRNTQDVVEALFQEKHPDGIGIIFMDEFDKKLVPSYSGGGSNVNAAVQAQLLTLVEGRSITKSGNNNGPTIDTSNTMFVGLGAFDMCRTKREATRSHSLGFGAGTEDDDLTDEEFHYKEITRQDMIDVGASYEFLGRFTSIINYYALDQDAMRNVIHMLKHRTEESFGCKIEIGEAMEQSLFQKANDKYGCRILGSTIHDAAMQGYLDMLIQGGDTAAYTICLEAPDQVTLRKTEPEVHGNPEPEVA